MKRGRRGAPWRAAGTLRRPMADARAGRSSHAAIRQWALQSDAVKGVIVLVAHNGDIMVHSNKSFAISINESSRRLLLIN